MATKKLREEIIWPDDDHQLVQRPIKVIETYDRGLRLVQDAAGVVFVEWQKTKHRHVPVFVRVGSEDREQAEAIRVSQLVAQAQMIAEKAWEAAAYLEEKGARGNKRKADLLRAISRRLETWYRGRESPTR